jgi:chromate transporter
LSLEVALRIITVFGTLSVLGFGGGRGIFPQMRLDVVEHYHWLTAEQFANFYAIGKLVPGPATIMVVLIGFGIAGIAGAALAAVAMFLPSSILMFGFARVWDRSEGAPIHTILAKGFAPVIVGLVWASIAVIGRGAVNQPVGYAIVGTVALLSLRTALPGPVLILCAGVLGAITKMTSP